MTPLLSRCPTHLTPLLDRSPIEERAILGYFGQRHHTSPSESGDPSNPSKARAGPLPSLLGILLANGPSWGICPRPRMAIHYHGSPLSQDSYQGAHLAPLLNRNPIEEGTNLGDLSYGSFPPRQTREYVRCGLSTIEAITRRLIGETGRRMAWRRLSIGITTSACSSTRLVSVSILAPPEC